VKKRNIQFELSLVRFWPNRFDAAIVIHLIMIVLVITLGVSGYMHEDDEEITEAVE